MKYDIAIIIINYNSTRYTLECLDQVQMKTNPELKCQLIVVDNNSRSEEFEQLKSNFPQQPHITLHRSEVNTGFGGGNMLGVPYANARYLLFLNNDAFPINDAIAEVYRFMEAHPKVGVATAQNYDEHGSFVPSFDHNKTLRRLLFGRGTLERSNPNKYPARKQEYEQPLEVNWVNGAFLFFRTDAFHQIGGFDTRIFLYFEEMDLCERLRKAGYQVKLVPRAKIQHYQGVSIGKSKVINKEGYLSYLYVIKKHYGTGMQWLTRLYLTLVFMIKPKKWYLIPTVVCPRWKNSLRHQQ